MLGEFEYLVLSAAARLGGDAYGAAIREEVERAAGQRCSIGALYTTIDRLEKKGLVTTWMGDPTALRGGRAKRMVKVTAKGSREAAAFYRAVVRASDGLAWQLR
ncbi:MAG TPA: PadR family transcriptional regulator [Vicinamibacterales bacterium]|nr:PadR family transcriptional regulator [Vicinamibacterales bacterium]